MALRSPGGSVHRNPVFLASLCVAIGITMGGLRAHGDGADSGGVDALGSVSATSQGSGQPVLSEADQRQAEARLRAAAKGRDPQGAVDANTADAGDSLAMADPSATSAAIGASAVSADADAMSEVEIEIENHLAAAKEAARTADYESAIEHYNAVLALDPNNTTARRAADKARQNLEKSQARLEQERQKQELQEKKDRSDALYKEGRELSSQGLYEEAAGKFKEALEANPDNRAASRDLEKALASQQIISAESAESAVAEEIPVASDVEDPNEQAFDQQYQEARDLAREGKYEEAIAAFDEALAAKPGDAAALKGRADAEKKLESERARLAQAARKEEARSIRERVDSHIIAAKQALEVSDYREAAAQAEAALALESENKTAKRILSTAHSEMAAAAVEVPAVTATEVETAVETEAEPVVETITAPPSSEEVATLLERARTYLAAGLLDEAEAEFNAILAIEPANQAALDGLQEVATRKQALSQVQAAEILAASEATALTREQEAVRHLERGKYLDSQGDIIGAMEEWRMALELKSDLAEAQVLVQQKQQAYDEAVAAKQLAEETAAKEKDFEARLDTVYLPLVEFQNSAIEDVLTNLATTSEFDIVAAADVEGTVMALLRNKTLREILDTVLIPNGWKWERVGNVIYVKTDFKTEIFTLPPDEFAKLEDILLEPERLENPEMSLQRLLWADEGPKVTGTDLRLNPVTNQLIITDSDANIEKVRRFLSNLPALTKASEPLIVEIYPLKPEIASKLYNIIKEALESQLTEVREGSQLLLDSDTNTLIIRDTQENINLVEQILTDRAILEGITQGTLEARKFVVTTDTVLQDDAARFRRQEIVTYTKDILEHMLYTQEGREEAIIRGRRIFEGRIPDNETEKDEWDYDGTITVVDTPDNLKRVESYLSTVSGQRQVTRFMRVEHADVDRLKRLLDLVTGRVQETTTEGGSIIEDYGQQQYDPTSQFGQRLNLRVRLTADTISNSIIAIAPQATVLDEIESLIKQLDLPEQQVEIEARLVEVSQEDIDNFNIDISLRGIGRSGLDPFDFNNNPLDIELLSAAAATGGTALSFGIIGETQLTVLLNYIRSSRTSEVLSAPKVTTVSAPPEPATVDVSTLQPFVESAEFDDNGDDDPTNNRLITTFATTNIGITLEVDPRVLPDGYVIMDINPSVSVLAGRLPVFIGGEGFENLTPALADLGQPIIDVREADVRVRVKDGDTLAIGGLIRDEVLMSEAKVPFFGDLPIIGGLFRDRSYSRTKTSLLILVTVRVISSEV